MRERAEWILDPQGYEMAIVEGLQSLEALLESLPENAEQERRVINADLALFREIVARIRVWQAEASG